MTEQSQSKRPIRSYVRRQGRITKAQCTAINELWSTYGLDVTEQPIDLDAVFGRPAPKILEIGFGMGEVLLDMAIKQPDKDFIGVDVHRPGVGALLLGIEKQQLSNIRVFCADVKDVLANAIPNHSLDAVHLFFPDPWPKKRHHKRRLVQPEFVELIRNKLKLSGYFHMATDWQAYADHMMQVMNEATNFINVAGANHFSPRPSYRPLTKFEQRGQRLGHGVSDLIFVREV